ncbi:MAG: vWA domain-containing protein [Planctomycetota bacterium]
MNGELILRPYFWPPAIVAVTLAVAAVTGWSAWRGRGGTGGNAGRVVVGVSLVMRLVAVAAVGGLLLGPSTVPAPETEPTRAPLNLLIDASASMQTRDMGRGLASGEEASRYVFGLERWLAADRLAALREHHDVRVYSFDRRPRAVVPDPENADSSQSYVVDSTYRLLTTMPAAEGGGAAEVPDGGVVVVLSDGRDSQRADPQRAASFAEARGIKLHTVTLGRAASRRDLALSATPRQPFLMIDEPGEIGVRLDPIHAGGAETVLRIRHEGEETARPVTLPDRGPRRVTVPVRHGAAGLYTYELSVDPLPGEAEVSNNTRTVFVEVVERRMRVLVLEGQPYWDTKFLAQSLRRDDRVEVTHLTQVTADRPSRTVTRHGRAAAVPAGLEDWAGYDVVVLGRRL